MKGIILNDYLQTHILALMKKKKLEKGVMDNNYNWN
jgi:hypothetical protein